MSSPTAIERLRLLVAEGRWAIAQRVGEHLDPARMIVIDRARVAATPRHAADRTTAALALLQAIRAAGHDVPADPAAELVAAITRRDTTDLPGLLAALRIPYGQRLPTRGATPAGQQPPRAPRPTPRKPAPPATGAEPAVGRSATENVDDQVLVAIANPRAPADEPLGPGAGRQTTAQRPDGSLLELPDDLSIPAARDTLRQQCDSGTLTCPVAGCRAPTLVLRAGGVLRPHFAHRPHTGVRHHPSDAWALRAIAQLQQNGHIREATSKGSGRWETDRGRLRLVGPNGRLDAITDEDIVVLATSHLRFAHRARLADGTWVDLVELPVQARDTAVVRAVDHEARAVWFVSTRPLDRLRRGLKVDGLERLRAARRTG